MHAAGSGEASRGILATCMMTVRKEGFGALYKGFTLIVIRRMIWCMVFFVIYERLMALLIEATQLEDHDDYQGFADPSSRTTTQRAGR